MIKKLLLLSILPLYSYACTEGFGSLSLKKQTLECISNVGTISLDAVKITGKANVTGEFQSVNSKIGQLKITGHTYLDNTIVYGDSVITGATRVNKSNLYSLSIQGNTEIKDSKIRNANISGNTFTDNSELQSLKTSGYTNITNHTKVNNLLYVLGNLAISNSQLSKVIATSEQIKLDKTIINGDFNVEPSSTIFPKNQYMRINGGRVHGNIIFKSNRGIVELVNSPVIDGKIIGATVNH